MISHGAQIELWKKFNGFNDNYFHELLDSISLDYDFRRDWQHFGNINDYYKDLIGLVDEENLPKNYATIVIIEGELKFGDSRFSTININGYPNPNLYTENYIIYEQEEIILEKLIKVNKMRSFI